MTYFHFLSCDKKQKRSHTRRLKTTAFLELPTQGWFTPNPIPRNQTWMCRPKAANTSKQGLPEALNSRKSHILMGSQSYDKQIHTSVLTGTGLHVAREGLHGEQGGPWREWEPGSNESQPVVPLLWPSVSNSSVLVIFPQYLTETTKGKVLFAHSLWKYD